MFVNVSTFSRHYVVINASTSKTIGRTVALATILAMEVKFALMDTVVHPINLFVPVSTPAAPLVPVRAPMPKSAMASALTLSRITQIVEIAVLYVLAGVFAWAVVAPVRAPMANSAMATALQTLTRITQIVEIAMSYVLADVFAWSVVAPVRAPMANSAMASASIHQLIPTTAEIATFRVQMDTHASPAVVPVPVRIRNYAIMFALILRRTPPIAEIVA